MSKLCNLYIPIFIVLFILSSTAVADEKKERARNYFGDELLTDQDGASHRFFSDLLSGRVVLINVIFTNCKDGCPLLTRNLLQVRHQLGNRFGSEFAFLSLSVDPIRDTPKKLKEFARVQNADIPGWYFLGAQEEIMKEILGRLGQWSDNPEDHASLFIAGNADKAHWIKIRPDSPPERIAADLLRLSE